MNILVIGNGFDLAHRLPTKYTDFLEFVKTFKKIKKNGKNMEVDCYATPDSHIKAQIIEHFDETRQEEVEELSDLMENNFWIEYFLDCPIYQKENWIDFESEIGRVIRSIDEDRDGKDFYGQIHELTVPYLRDYFLREGVGTECDGFLGRMSKITYQKLRDILIDDLYRLIRMLEIYLHSYVEGISCTGILPDLQDIFFDKVLSFNYTDTYRKIYDAESLSEYDFIHGKADAKRTSCANNMVLGIDEYLSEERKNIDVEFVAFKKFYQRIYKETGCRYKNWVDDIKSGLPVQNTKFAYIDSSGSKVYQKENAGRHNLYIFGHSLDVTDKEVLRELILHDTVATVIFYYSKDDFGTKIANLVKVIGQDELIRRTGGNTKTISFRKQQDIICNADRRL